MATSQSQWYWDGTWHPYPKNKQPISIELLPIPAGFEPLSMDVISRMFGVTFQAGGKAQNQAVFNAQGQRAATFKKTPKTPTSHDLEGIDNDTTDQRE